MKMIYFFRLIITTTEHILAAMKIMIQLGNTEGTNEFSLIHNDHH